MTQTEDVNFDTLACGGPQPPGLTVEQERAATAGFLDSMNGDPATVAVAAAAGSGKTKVLVRRVEFLIACGANPAHICVVTFTSAGATELLARLPGVRLGWCGTLHALLFRLLCQHGHLLGLPPHLSILTEEEADAALDAVAESLKCKTGRQWLWQAVAKRLADVSSPFEASRDATVAAQFVRQMKQDGELTFDAILTLGHKLLLVHPKVFECQHLLVDEVQDSALTDWHIYQLPGMGTATKFMVGDIQQSIYGFRGAYIAGFCRVLDHPDTQRCELPVNFRSSVAVVAASQRLVPPGAVATQPRPDAPPGSVTLVQYDSPEHERNAVFTLVQAAVAAGRTVAVLLRTNALADQFREALKPFLPVEPERKPGLSRLALAMLRLAANPDSESAAAKYITEVAGAATAANVKHLCTAALVSVAGWFTDRPPETLAEGTRMKDALYCFTAPLPETAEVRNALCELQDLAARAVLPCRWPDLLSLAVSREEPQQRGAVAVGTVHSAKGLEWDIVLLPAFDDETWPGKKTGEDLAEEIRVAYVAVTRAREMVCASWCALRPDPFATWKKLPRTPSRFAVAAAGGVL